MQTRLPMDNTHPGSPFGICQPTPYNHILHLNDSTVTQYIQEGEYQKAEENLLKMESLINDTHYDDKKLQFLHQHLLHYNYASILQKTWKTEECQFHLSKVSMCLSQQIEVANSETEKLQLEVEQVRVSLQQCAVLSQLRNHSEAYRTAEAIIQQQRKILSRSLEICEREIKEARKKRNCIDFNAVIFERARVLLKQLVEIQALTEVIDQCEDRYNKISEHIYFWKNLPQNNEKMIRKKLGSDRSQTDSSRNILGIKSPTKADGWIDSFNIGSVMMIKPLKSTDFERSLLIHVLSEKRILEQMFYTSIGYFSMATEMRFKEVDSEVKGLKESEKLIRLKDHPSIKKCKVLHLKAIELVAKIVPSSTQFLNHLIASFYKNYKSDMDAINEESSMLHEDTHDNKLFEVSLRNTQIITEIIQETPLSRKQNKDLVGHEYLVKQGRVLSLSKTPKAKTPKAKTPKQFSSHKKNERDHRNLRSESTSHQKLFESTKKNFLEGARSKERTKSHSSVNDLGTRQVRTLTLKLVDELRLKPVKRPKEKHSKV